MHESNAHSKCILLELKTKSVNSTACYRTMRCLYVVLSFFTPLKNQGNVHKQATYLLFFAKRSFHSDMLVKGHHVTWIPCDSAQLIAHMPRECRQTVHYF